MAEGAVVESKFRKSSPAARIAFETWTLLEGLELVESLLLDIATMDKETKQLMFSTHSQIKSSALPFEHPWIPYNLVDALLHSTAAVLSQGVSEDVLHTDVARSRGHDHRLRQQLSQHFYSINALQQ